MKTTYLFPPTLFLSLLLLVMGCGASSGGSSIDSSPEESRTTGNGTVLFKLDGADWTSSAEHPDNRFDVAALTDHETIVRVEALRHACARHSICPHFLSRECRGRMTFR